LEPTVTLRDASSSAWGAMRIEKLDKPQSSCKECKLSFKKRVLEVKHVVKCAVCRSNFKERALFEKHRCTPTLKEETQRDSDDDEESQKEEEEEGPKKKNTGPH
jgi:ribosomal protein L37AE/L43A